MSDEPSFSKTIDRDSFAKELAQALREAEERQQQQQQQNATTNRMSQEELIHTTYQSLCHDEPNNITSAGCRALANALLNPNQQYAISNRLVEGIHQCVGRYGKNTSNDNDNIHQQNNAQTPSNDEHDTEAQDSYNEHLTVSMQQQEEESFETLSEAFSFLAWTVHGRIPLACLLTNNISEASSLLGSFTVTKIETQQQDIAEIDGMTSNINFEDENTNTTSQNKKNLSMTQNDLNANIEDVSSALNGHGNEVIQEKTNTNDNNENDSLAEVWADESDASDYEFDSGWNADDHLAELATWAENVTSNYNPLELSKCTTAQPSWESISAVVDSLLSTFTSSKIASIPAKQWKTLRISDYMTQLILILMVPEKQKIQLFNASDGEQQPTKLEQWQKLGIQILNVFRDVTLQNIADSNVDILEEYLQLSRTLLQVYQSSNSNNNMTTTITTTTTPLIYKQVIPPATLVGISSLSAICSEIAEQYHNLISATGNVDRTKKSCLLKSICLLQSTVEQSCDDLTYLLEYSAKKESKDVIAVNWTYISFFNVLTLAPISNTTILVQTDYSLIPVSRAKLLLNSGLFRQWLLSWSSLSTIKSSAPEDLSCNSCCLAMEDSIYELCVSSPNLLGKYAWRFANFANHVTHLPMEEIPTFSNSDNKTIPDLPLMRIFLWNLLGIYLTAESATQQSIAPTRSIQWKTSKTTTAGSGQQSNIQSITKISCRQRAWSLYCLMCTELVKLLKELKLHRESEKIDVHQNWTQQKLFVHEFCVITKRITSIPLLQTQFRTELPPHKDAGISCLGDIKNELKPIHAVLLQYPVAKDPGISEDKPVEDKKDVPPSFDSKTRSRLHEETASVVELRKSLKILNAALEEGLSGQQSVGSKTD